MSLFYLLDAMKRDRPIRMASEIAGKPLTSYRPLVDDPETREDGSSDPTPDEFLERLAEVHAGVGSPLTRLRRRMDEGQAVRGSKRRRHLPRKTHEVVGLDGSVSRVPERRPPARA